MRENGKKHSNKLLSFSFTMKWGPTLLNFLLSALFATCRFKHRWVLPPSTSGYPGAGVVYVAWHRDILMLSTPGRKRNVAVAVSWSRDGELAARTAERMGYCCVRGSSSRGGISAIKGLMMMLKEGRNIIIFADGPRGPAEKMKAGVIYIAQKTGSILVPVAAEASRRISFKSWDRMTLPLPFSRISIIEGEPFNVPADLKRENFIEYCRRLTKRINELHFMLCEDKK